MLWIIQGLKYKHAFEATEANIKASSNIMAPYTCTYKKLMQTHVHVPFQINQLCITCYVCYVMYIFYTIGLKTYIKPRRNRCNMVLQFSLPFNYNFFHFNHIPFQLQFPWLRAIELMASCQNFLYNICWEKQNALTTHNTQHTSSTCKTAFFLPKVLHKLCQFQAK